MDGWFGGVPGWFPISTSGRSNANPKPPKKDYPDPLLQVASFVDSSWASCWDGWKPQGFLNLGTASARHSALGSTHTSAPVRSAGAAGLRTTPHNPHPKRRCFVRAVLFEPRAKPIEISFRDAGVSFCGGSRLDQYHRGGLGVAHLERGWVVQNRTFSNPGSYY